MEREKVLTVRDLSITFTTTAGPVHAIRGVNLDLYRGETLAIVGESGSGKSVTVKAAMGILAKNGRVDSGTIEYTYHHDDGTPETVDILKMKKQDIRRHINGKRIAMIFQDPMTSLDPTMPIGKQIMEGMIWHYKTPKAEAYKKAVELLKEVGITDAEERMKNYPHQLSGGMRQRVVIAIALACGWVFAQNSFAGPLPDVLGRFSLLAAFNSFSVDHVFDVRGILLYLSLIALLVFLTVQVVQKRRWN